MLHANITLTLIHLEVVWQSSNSIANSEQSVYLSNINGELTKETTSTVEIDEQTMSIKAFNNIDIQLYWFVDLRMD